MTFSESLIKEILVLNPLHRKFLVNAYDSLDQEAKHNMENYLKFLFTVEKLELAFIAASYHLIVTDTLREQLYFQKNKAYRYSSYEEVAGHVYQNDDYMTKYMYGLAITSFLWPQHQQIHHWFYSKLPKQQKGSYLEIGPGHGYYFMESQRIGSYDRFLGVDISPSSIRLTKSIVESGFFGNFNNYELKLANFLTEPLNEQFDAVIMGEVLEHVENPHLFIRKIKDVSKSDAFIFITTVINAAAVDHISLFRNVEELDHCIQKGGLKIKEYMLTSNDSNMSNQEVLSKQLPANIALILEK